MLVLTCSHIVFQDLKERIVYVFSFLLLGIYLTLLCLHHVTWQQYILWISVNVLMVSLVLLILFIYTKWYTDRVFLNESFGEGDLLFFYAFALGFPTYTFMLLFVGASLFSLVVYIFLKTRKNMDSVPMAGLMGIFLIIVILLSAIPGAPSLYHL
ncbi:MAG: hypothetical protein WBN11_03985 [Eudoraea sp.]